MANPTMYALSEEMKAQLAEALAQDTLIHQLNSEIKNPTKAFGGDPRVVRNFSPSKIGSEFSLDTEEGRKEHKDFAEAYNSDEYDRRKPYLDKIFDYMDQVSENVGLDLSSPEQLLAGGKRFSILSQQATYIENVMRKDPDYYQERYKDNPVKREMLNAVCDEISASSVLATEVYNRAGYSFTSNKVMGYTREYDNDIALDQAEASVKAAHQRSATVKAVMSGEPVPKLIIQDIAYPGDSALNASKNYLKGKPNPDQVRSAVAAFTAIDQFMKASADQRAMQQMSGINSMDLLFIDGKSANELFGEQYKDMEPTQRERAMKGQVMAALGSCKQHVEVGSLIRDEMGEPKVVIQPVKLDVTKSQPRLDQEFGPIHRRLFNWGPFKCRTAQERIDLLEAKDTGSAERQQEIASKLEEKVQVAVSAQKEKDAQEAARVQKEKDMAVIKEKVPQMIADYTNAHDEANKTYFKDAKEQQKDPSENLFGKWTSESGLKTLDRDASRESLAKLGMLRAGYSIADIISDDPQMDDARAKAGKEAFDMVEEAMKAARDKENNPEAHQKAQEKVATFLKESTLKLAEQKLPAIDYTSPKAVMDNFTYIRTYASLGIDAGQLATAETKAAIKGTTTPQQYKVIEGVGTLGSTFCMSAVNVIKYISADKDNMTVVDAQKATMFTAAASKKFLELNQESLAGKSMNEIAVKVDIANVWKDSTVLNAAMTDSFMNDKAGMNKQRDYLLGRAPLEVTNGDKGCVSVGGNDTKVRQQLGLAASATRVLTNVRALEGAPRQRGTTPITRIADKTIDKKMEGPGKN